jgi:hypothetical protein
MNLDSPDLLAQELAAVRANWEPYVTDLQIKAGRICAIQRLMYTWALLADLTTWGHAADGRWCYASYDKARAALDAWSGEDGTEPDNWHRHVQSGRRRDPDGTETVMP